MPVYDYECYKCKKVIEKSFKIDEKPSSVICECGDEAKHVITSMNFQLIGNCWSRDNYKNPGG